MPELLELREVIETHGVILAIVSAGVALLTAVVTRWVDRRTLASAHERLTAYEEEVRRLNEERADMLTRLEERGDELRRTRADLARLTSASRPEPVRPEPIRTEPVRPDRGTPEVATPPAGRPGSPPPPDWR